MIYDPGVAYEAATDFEHDPTVEEVSREQTTVDGYTAIAVELESTGEGLYPEGAVRYAYYIDLDTSTLIVVTHDIDGVEPAYEERRDILDTMMAEIEIHEVMEEEEAQENDVGLTSDRIAGDRAGHAAGTSAPAG